MEVKVTGQNEITISGNIKSIKDYQLIKDTITGIVANKVGEVVIKTPESFSITSSVIGFFMKVIFQDNIKLKVYVKDDRLYSLLEDLKLIETFNVVRY